MTFFITLCYSKGTTEPFFGAIAEAAERFETWGMGGGGGGEGGRLIFHPAMRIPLLTRNALCVVH